MSNGKRQGGDGPSSTSSVDVPSGLRNSTLVATPTGALIELPNSVLSELPSSLPDGLPRSLFSGLLSNTSVLTSNLSSSGRPRTYNFNATEVITVYTGQATASAIFPSLTVATTISVIPTSRTTDNPPAIAEQAALLNKVIITGSVLGGFVVFLIFCVAVGYCIYKRRRERRIRRRLGFNTNDSPPLTSLAPLPPTSPKILPEARPQLSTEPIDAINIASTAGGMGAVAAGCTRKCDHNNGGKASEDKIGTFGSQPRDYEPILTRPCVPSSPTGSPSRLPQRPPRPDRAVQFAMVPATTIQPSNPAMESCMRNSPERTIYGAAGGQNPSTPPQRQEMRSAHDGSPRYFPPTNLGRLPLTQESAAPQIPSLGMPSRRVASSFYSTDDLGLGNLMPGSVVESERMQTWASSGVFP